MKQALEFIQIGMSLLFLGWAALCDWKKKKIPRTVIGAGIVFCLIRILLEGSGILAGSLMAAIPGAVLLLTAKISEEKIGYGDGVCVLLLGILTGYRACMAVLCISLFLLSITVIFLLLIKRVHKKSKIPFIPFLFAAKGIAVIFGSFA